VGRQPIVDLNPCLIKGGTYLLIKIGAKLTKQLDVLQDVVHLRLQALDMVVEITLPPSMPRIIEKIRRDFVFSDDCPFCTKTRLY
jgi:hypothetical protein